MKYLVRVEPLKILGVDIIDKALTSGTAVYSDAIDVSSSTGYNAIRIKVDASGDVDLSFEVSADGHTWIIPENTSGTALGTIQNAISNSDNYIVFTPQLAKYMRFKFDPDANSTVTAEYIVQESV